MKDRLAFDRASIRRVDETSGHLHVAQTPISKANVCPYYGKEIPDFQALGLKPDQTYQLYRDPAELDRAAATFNGKPLMIIHKPQVAADHDPAVVVGSVSNANFDAPYLRADLAVWDGDAIALIESDEQRELSCGYFYKAVMEPGSADGVSYDGRMVDIVGNHCSLVTEGRAGPDVFVGDSLPPPLKQEPKFMAVKAPLTHRAALLAGGALRAYLMPKIAQDQKINLTPVLKGVTAAKWKTGKPSLIKAITAATKGKLAADADISDVVELLDQLDDVVEEVAESDDIAPPVDDDDLSMDADMEAKVREILGPDADDAKVKALCALMAAPAQDAPPPVPGTPKPPAVDADKEPEITKAAMDAAIAAAVKATQTSTIVRLQGIAEAHEVVAPHVGKIAIACDSAESVYKAALDLLKVDVAGVHPSAYRAILTAQPKPGDVPTRQVPRMAADAAASESYTKMFGALPAVRVA